MPFTFAHPAAVIPMHRVLRHRAVLSALVIGSMAPDFQNFLPLGVERADSHSLAGIFWFSLPVGLAVYLIFHLLLKKPLCALLPPDMAARLAPILAGPSLPRVSGAVVALSLLLGVLTHLAWDVFTHYSIVTTLVLPFLTRLLFSIGGYHVYAYKLLQHASSLGGTLLVWHWSRQWLLRAPAPSRLPPPVLSKARRHAALGILLAGPPLIGGASAVHAWISSYVPIALNDLVREAVVTGISGFGLLLIGYSAICQCFFLQRLPAADQPAASPAHPARTLQPKQKPATVNPVTTK